MASDTFTFDTPQSLLDRLRLESSTHDWLTFDNIYRPFIKRQLEYRKLAASDVDDLVQEVLARIFQALRTFQHNGRKGAFRKWLGKIVAQEIWRYFQERVERQKSNGLICQHLDHFDIKAIEELERKWEAEHDCHVLQKLLELIRPEFTATTWEAFLMVAIHGKSSSETGRILGVSPNAVMIAKSRVLSRLRCLGNEILDDL